MWMRNTNASLSPAVNGNTLTSNPSHNFHFEGQWPALQQAHDSYPNAMNEATSHILDDSAHYAINSYSLPNNMANLSPALSVMHSAPSTSEHLSPKSESSVVSTPQTPSNYSVMQTPPSGSTTLPTSETSTRLLSYREQYHIFLRARSLPSESFTGPWVPQAVYKPHTNSDRKRYVEEISLELPLYFAMESPSEFGIPLVDALHSRVKRMVDREKPVFEGRGPSVSIRLEWPGYRQWTRQIPTKDFRSPPGPITMAKLAKNIAKCVQRFIDENKDRNLEDGADARWKIGVRHHEVRLEDIVLVSVHHVSLGSWQPQFRLRRPKH
ncbi:hypothetical protein FA15DRAFT_231117 [Coprinopsis marcescibilis]|uniref:Uncharacterized protein n=1 Tax=Coprinopsis marcescibilis TaxID=230819 RepID=A0A5C3KFS0_COPMA|nr:hypothetical protein FA15DRAFT_231117 [Coprinopsis marcescibilis]